MELSLAKSHTRRHIWTLTMHKRDRRLADIGQGPGSSNLKTTSYYLEEQRGYICAYTRGLEDEFGI